MPIITETTADHEAKFERPAGADVRVREGVAVGMNVSCPGALKSCIRFSSAGGTAECWQDCDVNRATG
jgi:hypothetical protein